jgi:hypothetical protein
LLPPIPKRDEYSLRSPDDPDTTNGILNEKSAWNQTPSNTKRYALFLIFAVPLMVGGLMLLLLKAGD